jgi:hypothetical protein
MAHTQTPGHIFKICQIGLNCDTNELRNVRIKEAFHKLIDKIDNEETLKGYFELILRLNSNQTGRLWDTLSAEERNELLLSYDESFDPKNLISHEDVKGQHDKWLEK